MFWRRAFAGNWNRLFYMLAKDSEIRGKPRQLYSVCWWENCLCLCQVTIHMLLRTRTKEMRFSAQSDSACRLFMFTFYIPSSCPLIVFVGIDRYMVEHLFTLFNAVWIKPDRATGLGLVKKMSTAPMLCKGLCLFKHYHTQWMAVNCGGSCFWRHQSIFCLCIKYLGNHWTDLRQIYMEDVFGPSLGGVWRSKVKVTRDKSDIFQPIWWPVCVCVW